MNENKMDIDIMQIYLFGYIFSLFKLWPNQIKQLQVCNILAT